MGHGGYGVTEFGTNLLVLFCYGKRACLGLEQRAGFARAARSGLVVYIDISLFIGPMQGLRDSIEDFLHMICGLAGCCDSKALSRRLEQGNEICFAIRALAYEATPSIWDNRDGILHTPLPNNPW